jgi:hypothetical protein
LLIKTTTYLFGESFSGLGTVLVEQTSAKMHLRHHVFVKVARSVQLAEVGPRFEMKRQGFAVLNPRTRLLIVVPSSL